MMKPGTGNLSNVRACCSVEDQDTKPVYHRRLKTCHLSAEFLGSDSVVHNIVANEQWR